MARSIDFAGRSFANAHRVTLDLFAFDADKPASADGGPHICFNP
jgi:hypothetical protein